MSGLQENILFLILGILIPANIIFFRKCFLYRKIEITDFISCLENKASGKATYRIKIRNCGTVALYNLKVYARLEIENLEKKQRNTRHTFDIPLSFEGDYPYLPSFRATIMHIKCEEIQLDKSYYKEEIIKKLKQGDLDHLMLLGEKAILYIIVQAQDHSGVSLTKVKEFYRKDIKARSFTK